MYVLFAEWENMKKRVAEGKKQKKGDPIAFTDDTAMARSIAASLIEKKDVNVRDIATRSVCSRKLIALSLAVAGKFIF